MLSICRLQSVEHAMNYYEDDNYYCKEEDKGYTQWYGNGADELGLNGRIKVDDFHLILRGLSKKKEKLVSEKQKEQKVSFEKYLYFKKSFYENLNASNLEDPYKNQITEVVKEIDQKRDKISSEVMLKRIKKINSIVNQSKKIDIEAKQKLKKSLKKELEVFSKVAMRRPAYDLTFSAPKSLSLLALVDGNNGLVQAHREAVAFALSVVEKEYSRVTRVDSEKNRRVQENTGNIVAATFEHDVSRKLDPQLHTHCVVMNLTKQNGKWRALNSDGFFYNSKKIGAIYQNILAIKVKDLGYDIKINANGTFDIKGYSEDQIRHFSKRSEQLKELGATNQKEATKIVKIERDKKSKEDTRENLKEMWKKECHDLNIIHPISIKNKVLNVHYDVEFEKIIKDSLRELTLNDVTFRKDNLESLVLTKTLGTYTYEQVNKYVDNYLEKNAHQVGEYKNNEFVSNDSLDVEKKSIEMLNRGKNLFESIVLKEEARQIINVLHQKSIRDGFSGLNQGQQEAINVLLTSNDRIFCWQGVAGAGKTFSLYSATRIALDQGYSIKALAPSAEAAKNLAKEAQLEDSSTVASLLVQKSEVNQADGKQLWVIDEAGLLSAQDAYDLFRKAEIENARILLVGDTRQLSSVGAGNPLKQLQAAGMQTAQLTEGMRQKDLIIKYAVDLIAGNKHKNGLEILEKNEKVFVQDKENIIHSMALDYISLSKDELKESLFISSTNYEKKEITNLIRTELKNRDEIKNEIKAQIYVSRDINEFNLRYSGVYEKGDVLILNKRAQGLKSNIPYRVLEINNVKNTITVTDGSKQKILKLGSLKANLYREESIGLCVGDKIKWTKNQTVKGTYLDSNDKINKRLNGQYLTVTEINAHKNTAIVQYESGKKEEISLNKSNFLDYSYVTTVFSSQGKTCEKVYASLTNIDKENFYVAVSRAKNDCKLYTHDKDELYKRVDKSGANDSALEMKKSHHINHDEVELKNELKEKFVVKDEKDERKISESVLECIKIDRKIREKCFEVIYRLKLDPNGSECGQIVHSQDKNFDVIKNEINKEINELIGAKNIFSRSKLDIDTLRKTYSTQITDVARQVQNDYFNYLNNNKKYEKTYENMEKENRYSQFEKKVFTEEERILQDFNSKVKESMSEILSKISLKEDSIELKKISEYGKTNQEVVSKMIYYRINGEFGLTSKEKAASGRRELNKEELRKAMEILPQVKLNVLTDINQKLTEKNQIKQGVKIRR